MKSTITIHFSYRGGAIFTGHSSATSPCILEDAATVRMMIENAEKKYGPIIVHAVKKHTVTETDLTGILRDSVN